MAGGAPTFAQVCALLLCDHVTSLRGLPADRYRLVLDECRDFLEHEIARCVEIGMRETGALIAHRRRLRVIESEIAALRTAVTQAVRVLPIPDVDRHAR